MHMAFHITTPEVGSGRNGGEKKQNSLVCPFWPKLTIYCPTDRTVWQVNMVIRGPLPSRSNRKANTAEGMHRLIAPPRLVRRIHIVRAGENLSCLSSRSYVFCFCLSPQSRTPVLPCVGKMHMFFCKTSQLDNCCYHALFTCLAGCSSPCGCDFSHCTHQSWKNASCSGSKKHSPSCSRYDIKWRCKENTYWLWASMLLSFLHDYQEQKRLLFILAIENTRSLLKILSINSEYLKKCLSLSESGRVGSYSCQINEVRYLCQQLQILQGFSAVDGDVKIICLLVCFVALDSSSEGEQTILRILER